MYRMATDTNLLLPRICSGNFERIKAYNHVRGPKPLRFSNVTQFMAQKTRKNYPMRHVLVYIVGDYIDTENSKIGDTLT